MQTARANGDEPAERRYEYEARKAFAKVRELTPGDFDMQAQLGDLRLQEGKVREAIRAYEQALRIRKDRQVQRKLAELLVRDGRTTRAEPIIEELVRDEPEEPRNFILKGYFLSRTGKSDEAVEVLEKVTREHPEILMGHYVLGLERIRRGEQEEGRRSVEAALRVDPNFAGARLVKAGLLAAEGKVDEAVAECDGVIAKDPMHFDAMFEKARFLLEARRIPEAIAVYRDMKTRWPDSVAVQELLGQAYLVGGQPARALVEYEEARRANPDSTRVLRGLATVLKAQNNIDRAVEEYKTFLENNPTVTIAWIELAELYEEQKQWGHAESAYKQAVRTAATNIAVHDRLAAFYMRRGMYPEAVSSGRRVLREIPSKSGQVAGFLIMAQAYQAQGKLDEAETNYRKAVQADESNLRVKNALANFYMRNRKYDEAVGVGREIVAQAVDSPSQRASGHLLIAHAYEAADKLDEAAAAYQKALEVDPSHVVAANGWAWMLVTKKKDYAEAVRVAEPFLEKWPGFPELHDTVGWAYALDGKPDKAEPILRRCVGVLLQQLRSGNRRMGPAAATMMYHCASVLNTNGKQPEAKSLLEPLQKLQFPESASAREIYEKIK
jgi:tetratricopeptide (TPR) repeat protein